MNFPVDSMSWVPGEGPITTTCRLCGTSWDFEVAQCPNSYCDGWETDNE